MRSCAATIVATATVFLAACGGGAKQDASEPKGNFRVSVAKATFPTSQTLAQHTHLVIEVHNDSGKTIPNIAVTILNPQGGTAAEAFGQYLPNQQVSAGNLASRSRAVWIIDQPPGLCGYSCKSGGPGGAVTAYNNTWALGALAPNATATFKWAVTAVKTGTYTVEYQVAAGLNGKARAVLSDGSTQPIGRFNVTVHSKPAQAYVSDSGKVVQTK